MAIGGLGVVASPHVLASKAAIDALECGGNAVDAAVAAAAVSTVVQPFSSSLGGVGWAAVHVAATRQTEMLQFSGIAPAGLDTGVFRRAPSGLVDWRALERDGAGLASGLVPAAVAGWEELVARRGRLSFARALEPAIRLASEGFPVSELLHEMMSESAARLAAWPQSASIFLHDGRPYAPGERLVQADLAATLERVAAYGWAELAAGPTGREIVSFHRANGGALRADDLGSYRPSWHQPLVTSFRGRRVHAAPAPLGDVSFICALQLLDSFPPFDGPLDPGYVHVSVESAKLVAAERAELLGAHADPEVVAALLSPSHTAELRSRITGRAEPVPVPVHAGEDTITLAVLDAEGNAVHLMQTVGTLFGTACVAGRTGILLNSCLNFAYIGGSGINRIVPGAGLEQNPCLAVVTDEDGRLELMIGSPGGKTRVETVRQMLVNVLDFGMNLQQAVDAPRFLTTPAGAVSFEARYGSPDPSLQAALEERGHRVVVADEAFGSGQAVGVLDATETRAAAADWRREAVALAY
jgi:gamma-glutamyltranspeptidase/glutathione hydrolase